jgi:uncharacterized protein YndB with AHSA1/START domain
MGLAIGTLHVRRSIFINASPKRVWEEFSTAKRISAWLDRGHSLHSIDPRLGGRAEMSVEIEGKRRHYGGPILVVEPAREMSLEIVWSDPWDATYATATPSYWTFRLTPVHSGTLVELFHHGFELTGADAADNLEGYEQGWDVKHLTALRAAVEA